MNYYMIFGTNNQEYLLSGATSKGRAYQFSDGILSLTDSFERGFYTLLKKKNVVILLYICYHIGN